jgi:sec-independent protein translocase protein TatC
MSRKQPDEDLFKDSTMTFGEHLGELRVCLFRALVGIVLGFLIGLAFGRAVVAALQTPLRNALEVYLLDGSAEKFAETLAKERPELSAEEREELVEAFRGLRLTSEEVYLNPNDIVPELRRVKPDLLREAPAETEQNTGVPPREKMLKVRIWRDAQEQIRIVGLTAAEAFLIYVKASLITGIVLSSPWVFYQIWMFVAAGLYPHEKNYVRIYLPFSLCLFLAGASVAFFFVFEPVLEFFFGFYRWLGIEPDQRIGPWLNFVLLLPLGFGLSFQLPLVMLFLERIGVMTVASYIDKWRIAILAIFVISMVLTPADPWSMTLMAVPLSFLYVGGIFLCKYLPRKKNPFE